jgi:hypothetical protein
MYPGTLLKSMKWEYAVRIRSMTGQLQIPHLPAAEILSFLKESRNEFGRTERDLAKSLNTRVTEPQQVSTVDAVPYF